MGRPSRRPKNAPRTIDLDLLYFGDSTFESDSLSLPHPRLGERRFVLEPLASIRPDLVLPGDPRPVRERLAELLTEEPPLKRVAAEW